MKGRKKSPRRQRAENFLFEFIKFHRGRNNCVSAKEILQYLSESGNEIPPKSLYPIIHKLMYEKNVPICYVSMKGYYWATSREDIEPVISDLKQRISGFQRHIDFLDKFEFSE